MISKDIQPNDLFFALDIGTRSIVGMLGKVHEDRISIEHYDVKFHTKRAMVDGQIHDIGEVARIARQVKESLENKSGYKLKRVAIAAAGRSLKTIKLKDEMNISVMDTIDKNIINVLELDVLQKASEEVKNSHESGDQYHIVGHTITRYYLDDNIIYNPLGHKGSKLGIEIIGTFLPQIVIDSLFSVMNEINLEVEFMTLEPIAAIDVVVPENARLLNLALVDIGAGTSDIALTKDGTVFSFGMASVAGDEITETIAQKYLMDFDSAEILKCSLNQVDMHVFHDIVGMEYTFSTEEILMEINPVIENLAEKIASILIEQNGRTPSAVFLIGGGAQIPTLSEKISERLQLPKERIVIRGAEGIITLEKNSLEIKGPELMTPIGILNIAAKNKKNDFIEVHMNDQTVNVFRSNDIKVSDILVLTGYQPRDLITRKGKSLSYKINGISKLLYGQLGKEARIFVNSEIANMESKIEEGDNIHIEPAVMGSDAETTIKNLLQTYLEANPNLMDQDLTILLNGKKTQNLEAYISDGDEISIEVSKKNIDVNKESFIKKVEPNYPMITVLVNGEKVTIQGKSDIIFVDVFDYIDFDTSRLNGVLITKHNGENAHYNAPLNDGDVLEIKWDKM